MSYTLYFDGGSRSNPGPSGCGWFITNDLQPPHEGFKYIGHATNNEAEYQALIYGLKYLSTFLEAEFMEIQVFGDSKLVIEQMNRSWKVKAQNLIPLWKEAHELAKVFKAVKYTHIDRSLNVEADRLANKAIDLKL